MTFPTGYYGFRLYQENKKPIKIIANLNKYLFRFAIFGVPSFNIYMISMYRLYFSKHPSEDKLKL
jgi:hypothetical protein